MNKIETVRILRARPAFYPMVRDRYAGAASPVVDTGAHVLTGDFNAEPTEPVFATVTGSKLGYVQNIVAIHKGAN